MRRILMGSDGIIAGCGERSRDGAALAREWGLTSRQRPTIINERRFLWFAGNEYETVARLVLERGADVDAKSNDYRWTALH
jgi:hypothetical protein